VNIVCLDHPVEEFGFEHVALEWTHAALTLGEDQLGLDLLVLLGDLGTQDQIAQLHKVQEMFVVVDGVHYLGVELDYCGHACN